MREWRLLHLAAAEGYEIIVRYLLRLGADWQAESWPSYTWVNEELRGVRFTPARVARSESTERQEQILKLSRRSVASNALRQARSAENSSNIPSKAIEKGA